MVQASGSLYLGRDCIALARGQDRPHNLELVPADFKPHHKSRTTIGVTSKAEPGNGQMMTQSIFLTVLAAAIAAIKVRLGPSAAATYTFNGSLGARVFGGTAASFLQIEERMG